MIEKEKIETIKQSIDLKSYIQSRGIELKKNGKGLLGLCPFHNDKNPSLSVTPSKHLWQCFGCGEGGDVIRFVELFDKVDFKTAFKKLSGNDSQSYTKPQKLKKTKTAVKKETLTVKEKKLLARVTEFYQHTLTGEDARGIKYLTNERCINNIQSIKDFGTGYVNGTLAETLPHDEDIISILKKIGILNPKGHEIFYNCVVFPLYDNNGAVVSLYGRSIDEDNVSHLYLPGDRTGIVNRQAVNRSQTILLTESVIDALTLYDQGFKNVIPAYGVNGLLDDHLFLFNRKIKEVYIVFDADDSGRKGAEAVSERLKEKNIMTYTVDLPVKDVNIFFNRHTPEEFEILLKKTNPKSLEQSESVSKRKQTAYKQTEHGFIVGYGQRQYQVKGIQKGSTQLKATIKVSKDIKGNMPFELATIDLYSSRSRVYFAKLCADLLGASEELIREDLGKLLNLVEDYKPSDDKKQIKEATKEEKNDALNFLKNPNIFNEILKDMDTTGVVGEETNKIVCYLTAISRKLDKPLSTLIQSRSSAGKSTIQNIALSFVPDEDYEKYTRITDQALFYKAEDSLINKILAIEEDAGMGGAAYSIRNIQSAQKITVAATGKDPGTGRMKTETYTVKGPVSVMLTTTDAELDQETASRFIFLSIDESKEMTAKIHEKQRESRTLEGLINKKKTEKIIKKHQTAQRLLKSVAVVNNFTRYLSYPSTNLVTRRDHDKYLGLIEAIAYLHQYQREIKKMNIDGAVVEYIEVSLDDIEKANQIANDVLGQSLDELARPSRTLLSSVYKMVKEMSEKSDVSVEDISFNRRMIREYIGWSDWQIKKHIKQLEELEYLNVKIGCQGKQYSYALNYHGQGETGQRFYMNLTPVAEIKKLVKAVKNKK